MLVRERANSVETVELSRWRCAISFFGSLFGGQDTNLSNLIGQFSQTGTQQTGQGTKNENAASGFWNSILSGNASTQAQALAPEISSLKTSAAQTNKTNAIFGNRSGGNTASAAATDDKVHGDITNLIGSLTNSSASSLASLGSNQVSQGQSSLSQEEQANQQRIANWSQSILGQAIGYGTGKAFSYGLNSLFAPHPPKQNNNNNNDGGDIESNNYGGIFNEGYDPNNGALTLGGVGS